MAVCILKLWAERVKILGDIMQIVIIHITILPEGRGLLSKRPVSTHFCEVFYIHQSINKYY